MRERTDENLMTEVANGNLSLLKVLFERHHGHVYNFLYKMSGDKMLSEDLTQDVFYKLMMYRTTYNNGKFSSWLFTIARNNLKTHFRRHAKNHENLEGISLKIADDRNQVDDYSHLHLALEKLNISDRELLVLHRFQEIKYNEIAEITGSTPGAIKTKVSRALKKLKKIYFETI